MAITYSFDIREYVPASRLDFFCADTGASLKAAILEGDYLGYWDLRDYRILAPLVEFVEANRIPLSYFRDAVLGPEQVEMLWSFYSEFRGEFAPLLRDNILHADPDRWVHFSAYRTASIIFIARQQRKALYTVAD